MFRILRCAAAWTCAGLLYSCAGGGTLHRIGSPPLDVLAETDPGEQAKTPTPIAAMWLIEGPRAQSGDAKLWAIYARVVADAVKQNADGGLPIGDEAGRAEMAKAANTVGPVTSKYLSTDLPTIAEAGFMKEHAWLELEGGGDAPAVRPDRALAYVRWRAATLPDMVPETEIGVLAGRRKLERHTVPWYSVVPALGQFVKFAIERNDCAAITSASDILMPAWTKAKAAGVAFSMDADQRHLEYLKANVKESQAVGLYPLAYREAAIASAQCLRSQGRFDEALSRAVLATEMDPLCSHCWGERAASHLALGEKDKAKAAAQTSQTTAINPGEQKAAREVAKMIDDI